MIKSSQIKEINTVINHFFETHPNTDRIKAKDLMPDFVQQGVFKVDYERKGLPIRNLLRSLDKQNLLHLIPFVFLERKAKNTYWHFKRI
mgnify:CR=1 FL=1